MIFFNVICFDNKTDFYILTFEVTSKKYGSNMTILYPFVLKEIKNHYTWETFKENFFGREYSNRYKYITDNVRPNSKKEIITPMVYNCDLLSDNRIEFCTQHKTDQLDILSVLFQIINDVDNTYSVFGIRNYIKLLLDISIICVYDNDYNYKHDSLIEMNKTSNISNYTLSIKSNKNNYYVEIKKHYHIFVEIGYPERDIIIDPCTITTLFPWKFYKFLCIVAEGITPLKIKIVKSLPNNYTYGLWPYKINSLNYSDIKIQFTY